MRILWLSGNASLYNNNNLYSGGWIGALEAELVKYPGIELGISFIYNNNCSKKTVGTTTYYPLKLYPNKLKKIKHNLFLKKYDRYEINYLLKVIEDFKPDIIHVWGTEISFGLISKYTKIPVIIHIQGILNPVYNSLFIPGLSKYFYVRKNGNGVLKSFFNIQSLKYWKYVTKRELEIFKNCSYFIGRTQWDKQISQLFSPNSKYYTCNEILRPEFYYAQAWDVHNRNKLVVISVLSNPIYKGIDLILKCANILNNYTNLDFEWNIFGVKKCNLAEKLTSIEAKKVHINYMGTITAKKIITEIQNSDVFVHTSYIDNSPNSVCEAQIVGIPIISTNVGGISSLIEHKETGYLIPSNDPYLLASSIIEIKKNPVQAIKIGRNARTIASKRHDKSNIKNNIIYIYKEIINANYK